MTLKFHWSQQVQMGRARPKEKYKNQNKKNQQTARSRSTLQVILIIGKQSPACKWPSPLRSTGQSVTRKIQLAEQPVRSLCSRIFGVYDIKQKQQLVSSIVFKDFIVPAVAVTCYCMQCPRPGNGNCGQHAACSMQSFRDLSTLLNPGYITGTHCWQEV